MKQIGNLAVVCARRQDVLLQVGSEKVCVHVGAGPERNTLHAACILVYCGIGSFFFWLVFWIFGIKEFFGISTIIIGAILGFIVWILVIFFNNGGFGNYEHEDMDHDMPTHVIIDK